MPNFAGFFLTPIINSVRNSASSNNGNLTWAFSQIKDPVASIIGKDKISQDGVCEMLSAKWIECHAKDGHLGQWLQGSGQEIDPSKIRQLMQLFIIGNTMNRSAMVGRPDSLVPPDQTAATVLWLKEKGLVRRTSIASPDFNSSTGTRDGARRKVHASSICAAVTSNWNALGTYRTIGIWGPNGGHAMAAWVAQDVAFFDPNFGEFWFEKKADFIKWFPKFFEKSCYSLPKVGLCERYEVMDFGIAR
jgi:hypothetical protein